MDAGQPTLPQLLREAGYYTGLVLDTANNVGAGLHKAYDEYHLITVDVNDGVRPEDIPFPVSRAHLRQNGQGYARDRAKTAHYRYEEDWFVARTMRRACRWLEDHARRDKWFLWVDTFEIHEDWMPPPYYLNAYEQNYVGPDYTYPNYGYTDIYTAEALAHLRACYAGEVTLTDRWVGHLLRQVDLMGLLADTCMILTSDHGMYIGEHGRAGKHTVDPNDPWPIYDTVGRLPLLVYAPYRDLPRRIDALCQAADVMPTVLEMCGIAPPQTTGRSWLPLLKGQEARPHEAVYTTCHSGSGPGRIDYLNSLITVTNATHTAIYGPAPHRPELYDHAADPEQVHDIAAQHPDLVADLRAGLVRFMIAHGAEDEYVRTYGKGE
jgi:arylsulfatase A-like enzyme